MNTSKPSTHYRPSPLKAILLIFFFSLSFYASGQGSIQGKIIDSKTGETLPGAHAKIRIGNNLIGDVTDNQGKFWVKPLDAGQYDLEISFTGYQKKVIENIRVNSNKITRLKPISLKAGHTLNTTTITWEEPLIDETGGMVQTINSKDYETLPSKLDIKESLTKLSTDISMDQSTRKIHFRGARADDFIYIIDGVKQRGGEAHIPSGAIKSMNIYAGGIPAQYGDFTGGVIVIETKGYFDWLAEQD